MTRRARYRLLSRYGRRQRGHLVALVGLALLPAAMAALQPLPLKLFVDNALGDVPLTGVPAQVLETIGVADDPRSLVVFAGIAAIVLGIVTYLVSDATTLYWEWVGARMVRDAAKDVFDHLQRLSPHYHARTPEGDSLSVVTTDSSAPYTAVNAALVSPVMATVTMVTVGLSAWRLNRGLTLVLLAMTPGLAVLSRHLSGRLKRAATRARSERVAVTSFVSQIVHALPIVQAFTAESQNLRAFRSITDRAVDANRRTAALEASAESVAAVLGAVAASVILVLGGQGVVEGDVTVGDLVVFLAYARVLDRQFRSLLSVGRQLRLAEVGMDRLHEVVSSDDRVRDPDDPVAMPTATAPRSDTSPRSPGRTDDDRGSTHPRGLSVQWDHVTFGYESGRPILHDIDLEVDSGETVALLGRTGAGKSTLVGLVPRLFDPWEGAVRLGGVDVRRAAVADVRSRVAVLRQEPLILPATVAENVAIARPGASLAEIEDACQRALAAEFIDGLPDGYETVLAENGSSLSGGQRQRLAIARAFLKDASILVLDEPTSALDTESEALLVRSIEQVSEGRTVLVIAHRLSTIRRADRAVVLEDGRVVEMGTHDQLLERDGSYARFHQLQTAGAPT
jgi:ATP-binding cassette subfamily B protein